MPTLKEFISPSYFNDKLAEEFDSEALDPVKVKSTPSPKLELLRRKIFWAASANNYTLGLLGEPGAKSIADMDFEITPEKLEILQPMLQNLGVNASSINFEDYLNIGEEIIEKLGFEYQRLTREQVQAYIQVTKDQLETFDYSNMQSLGLGNLGEAAMRRILKKQSKNGKKFKARGFLFHNLDTPQEEKDVEVFIRDKTPGTERDSTLGVRTQEDFDKGYLYPKRRCAIQNCSKIAEHVVFFHHFGYHIFYITGVVEKEFLFKTKVNTTLSPMEEFVFPEYANPLNFNRNRDKIERFCESYGLHPIADPKTLDYSFSDEDMEKIKQRFAKRISFSELMGRLADR